MGCMYSAGWADGTMGSTRRVATSRCHSRGRWRSCRCCPDAGPCRGQDGDVRAAAGVRRHHHLRRLEDPLAYRGVVVADVDLREGRIRASEMLFIKLSLILLTIHNVFFSQTARQKLPIWKSDFLFSSNSLKSSRFVRCVCLKSHKTGFGSVPICYATVWRDYRTNMTLWMERKVNVCKRLMFSKNWTDWRLSWQHFLRLSMRNKHGPCRKL